MPVTSQSPSPGDKSSPSHSSKKVKHNDIRLSGKTSEDKKQKVNTFSCPGAGEGEMSQHSK